MKDVKNILKTKTKLNRTPVEFYQDLISHILNVGTPYSSFVEIMLCNMFLTHPKENEFWRYNLDKPAVRKFGDKNLAQNLSGTLGCLFQPNKQSFMKLKELEEIDDINNLTIYEKIWYELFD